MNKRHKLLVIDGDKDVLHLLQIVLEFHGFDVEGESDPQKGLIRLETEHFDLLVTDYLMKSLNGLELISKVRDTNSDIKIVLLTSKDLTQDESLQVLRKDAVYLRKPFSPEELVQKLTGIMFSKEIVGESLYS